jgi:hypothetical protein
VLASVEGCVAGGGMLKPWHAAWGWEASLAVVSADCLEAEAGKGAGWL